jgi:hypothetical protein
MPRTFRERLVSDSLGWTPLLEREHHGERRHGFYSNSGDFYTAPDPIGICRMLQLVGECGDSEPNSRYLLGLSTSLIVLEDEDAPFVYWDRHKVAGNVALRDWLESCGQDLGFFD